jgi:hypothetical protein
MVYLRFHSNIPRCRGRGCSREQFKPLILVRVIAERPSTRAESYAGAAFRRNISGRRTEMRVVPNLGTTRALMVNNGT